MMIKNIFFCFLILLFIIISNYSNILAEEIIDENFFIKKLGEYGEIEKIKYENAKNIKFKYKNKANERIIYSRYGDYYEYNLFFNNSKDEEINKFIKFVNDISGEIINYDEDNNSINFNTSEENSVIWWGEADFDDDYSKIYLIKEWNLIPGRTITRKLIPKTDKWIFKTYNNADTFTTLKLVYDYGLFRIRNLSPGKNIGGFNYSNNYYRKTYGQIYRLTYLDDMPKEYSDSYWRLDSYRESGFGIAPIEFDEDKEVEISITMEEVTDLPGYKNGDKLGALIVKNIDYAQVSVEPMNSMEISYPEIDDLSYKGDISPEGDTVFWLPPGYWRVNFKTDIPKIKSSHTHLVPVSSGETTVLKIPNFLDQLFSEKNEGGLSIIESKEIDDQVIITVKADDNINIIPTLKNTEVKEGGQKVKIDKIKATADNANIVLLLDSSGSMKGQMEKTIAAAKEFIDFLPKKTSISVIDFDTKAKLLAGENKEEIVSNLVKVRADGATALYDTVLEGINLLQGKDCPYILLFTDGVDANWDDSGPGSIATLDEVLLKVKNEKIPFYTIGFGPNHDNSTLTTLADISGGKYYPADNQEALIKVFNDINNNISYSYQISYNRPKKSSLSDIPVVLSIMMDVSGSMHNGPSIAGSNYRIGFLRNLLRNLILNLPDDVLCQLQSFNDKIYINQIFTDNKAELLQALGELRAGGKTEILKSTEVALNSLKNTASKKRILIYITDAALGVGKKEKEEFDLLLKEIAEENINVIWFGLGMEEQEATFAHVAELSGGEYLLTEDISDLENKFEEIIQNIKEPPEDDNKFLVKVEVRDKIEGKEDKIYSALDFVELTAPDIDSSIVLKPEKISYETGLEFVKYNKEIKKQLSRTDIPDREMVIRKNIPINAEKTNQAMNLNVREAVFLGKINNIEIPRDKRLLALSLELTNILPEQEVIIYPDGSKHPAGWINSTTSAEGEKVIKKIPYLIPNIFSHLFLNYNNSYMYRLSPITWITEEPLVPPGERSLILNPEEKISGICVFLVDSEPLKQSSLHFYDTEYGHISIPLVGKIDRRDLSIENFPKKVERNISDAFTFSLVGTEEIENIEGIEAGDDSLFKVVEADIYSKIQALLDLEARKNFLLNFADEKGNLYTAINPVTTLLPFGLIDSVILAPGSKNKVRFAFQTTEYLKENYNSSLFIELKDEDIILPLEDKKNDPVVKKERYKVDNLELQVNEIAIYDKWAVADLTFFDKKDGESTLLKDAFILVRDDYSVQAVDSDNANQKEKISGHKGLGNFSSIDVKNELVLRPDKKTSELLFGYNDETVIYDGKDRRTIVLFKLPGKAEEHSWSLQSPFFSDLNELMSKEQYSEPEILIEKIYTDFIGKSDFDEQIEKAIFKTKKEYLLQKRIESKKSEFKRINLSEKESQKNAVPAPKITTAGDIKFNEIENIEQLIDLMKGLKWLPSENKVWEYCYSPAAVLTQNWGSENDIANLMEISLAKMGYIPERKVVELTDSGIDYLIKKAKIDRLRKNYLPALSYREDGIEKIFIIPFMKDYSEIKEFVKMLKTDEKIDKKEITGNIKIYLKAISKEKNINTQFATFTSALAGNESANNIEEILIMDRNLSLAELSKDLIDIAYIITGREKGELYTAICESSDNKFIGEKTLDSGLYDIIGEKIKIKLPSKGHFEYDYNFRNDESIDGVFHSLAINLPDIVEANAKSLEKIAQKIHREAENPDEISSLCWYARTAAGRFLLSQSKYEKELADILGLTVGRNNKARCFMITQRMANNSKFKSSIDLMGVENEIHNGSKKAKSAFNIFSGIYLSKLEAEILPGKEKAETKLGLFEIWRNLPEEAHLVSIERRNKKDVISYLEENEFSDKIIKAIDESRRVILIPNKPALINGEKKWAWLEIDDGNNYQTISVLDTGEHGSMIETTIISWLKEGANFMAGAFIGVDKAIWSLGSFSLILDNYEEIKAVAEEFAKSLADSFSVSEDLKTNIDGDDYGISFGGGIGGTFVVSIQLGPISGSFDPIQFSGSVSPNFLGYASGFRAGVEYYFNSLE